MRSFNLSDWALKHRSLVWYFMIAFMVAGFFAYLQLGRQEDPDFTIKTMVIQAQWPGASAEEVTRQVTDRIEKKLEELESLDYTKSVTVAGQTTVFVYLRDSTKAERCRPDLGSGAQHDCGHQSRFAARRNRAGLQRSLWRCFRQYLRFHQRRPKLAPVARPGRRYSREDFDRPECRQSGHSGCAGRSYLPRIFHPEDCGAWYRHPVHHVSLQAQNAVTASGVFQEGPERISVRVSGEFASEASLKAINLRINDRFFPLTDVATITRGYVDPPTTLFRFNGQPAIALAIGMKTGANLLKFGEALKEEMSKIVADLPIGVGVHLVADQPVVVEHAVSGFTEALFEAVVIVLAISFISLGFALASLLRSRFRWFSQSPLS